MIIEHATIKVPVGQGAAFEAAVAKAVATVFPRAQGWIRASLLRCIEQADTYIVAISWERLEDHTVGFRESPLFQEWRALVGPFFASPPAVLHYEVASA